ncbi:unnamed protein product [Rotaria sordida]|uniref:LTD domain-containing protein n=1 Tax=Rotaria sordida TaxID=392033 RepID=A0A814B8A8_9BILA|nr:unnamed protein product [Rotaria sordida]CAF0933913.1 unnamed protein product [Rotaria sordida]
MHDDSRVSYNRSGGQFVSTFRCQIFSSINIEKLQVDLQSQHQHEKDALTELNQRFRAFIDRVQQLELQNSRYLTEIENLQRNLSGLGSIDSSWDERYHSQNSNLSILCHEKIDFDLDFELYQLQNIIYELLIETGQEKSDRRISSLEEELKQSSSQLNSLRTSCRELEHEIERVHAERESLLKQYFSLTHDWCNIIRQRKHWNVTLDSLKSEIAFYKKIRSYSGREFDSSSIKRDVDIQFWRSELDRIVKAIRSDFEIYYGEINRKMQACFEKKMAEIQKCLDEPPPSPTIVIDTFSIFQEKWQIEYDELNKSLSYEKDLSIKLQAKYDQLTVELRLLQQDKEPSNELEILKEDILSIIYDINQIECSKNTLEAEIIVYRHLLSGNEIKIIESREQRELVRRCPPAGSESMSKIIVKKNRQGCIGIEECALNGAYITLTSNLTTDAIDISRWTIEQHLDSGKKLQYTIPDGVQIERSGELKIYSKIGNILADSSSGQKVLNNDLVQWGTGNTIETRLFDQNGDQEASYSKSVSF